MQKNPEIIPEDFLDDLRYGYGDQKVVITEKQTARQLTALLRIAAVRSR